MNLISIIILGIIQGIAEFLPISSSAHLIICRDLFGIASSMSKEMELTFDVALHLGTLLAIFVFFFKDFIKMRRRALAKISFWSLSICKTNLNKNGGKL